MLDAYNLAKMQARVHKVETSHGNAAEAEFRRWLSEFLPGKYGVTAGYIVSQGVVEGPKPSKMPHFDVIVYDRMESPTLWIEESPDHTGAGKSRALPVEYVHAVLEVKAALTTKSTKEVLKHFHELDALLAGEDKAEDRIKKYLPSNFILAPIFFELRKKDRTSLSALDNLVPKKLLRGYGDGLVLSGESKKLGDVTGRVFIEQLGKKSPQLATVGKGSYLQTLLNGFAWSTEYEVDGKYSSALLGWSELNFSRFFFDLVARLNGTYQAGEFSSLYGLNWYS